MEKIKIAIVDDDELVTMSLEMILSAREEFQVVGKGNSGEEAVDLYHIWKPDLLLLDIRMKDTTGVDVAERILKEDPEAKILFLTTFSDEEYIIRALELGVKGYLLKQDYQAIPECCKAVYGGQNVFGGEIISKLPKLLGESANSDGIQKTADKGAKGFDYTAAGITEKEYELIQLVSAGLSNKEISEKIFLSEGTIKNYISNILDKLGLRDRTQLAIFYLNHNS